MAAVSSVMAMSGVAAPPATQLSSSSAFEAVPVQQSGVVRLSKVSRNVAVRASLNEEQAPASQAALKAIVAAGAALALTVSPMSVGPASAGFFDRTSVKAERGSSSDFPRNEGTGNSVGNGQRVRGSANSGTPLGEGAGGNLVGNNQATRNNTSGTPFGEGSKSGSGVNLSAPNVSGIAENAKSKIPDISTPNPLKNIGSLNPFQGSSTPDVSGAVGDAKNAAANVAEDVKSKTSSNPLKDIGNLNPFQGSSAPDVSGAVGDAKNAAANVADDVKSKTSSNPLKDIGNLNPFQGSSAPDVSGAVGDAKNAAANVADDVKRKTSSNPLKDIGNLNPFKGSDVPDVSGAVGDAKNAAANVADDVKSKARSNPLKDIGNLNPFKGSDVPDVSGAAGDAKNAASNVASDVKSQAMKNPVADGAKTLLNKGAGVPNPRLNPIEDGKQLLNKNSVGSIGDAQSAAGDVASDVKGKAMNNPIADGAKTILNKVAGVPDPQVNPIEDGKQLINKNTGN